MFHMLYITNNIVSYAQLLLCHLQPMGDGCDGEYCAAETSWMVCCLSIVSCFLTEDIDPNRVLARLAGANMIHTEDSIVKYYWGMLDSRKKR